MAASTSDKFKHVGVNTVTTLSSPGKAMGATSINVGSTTNFPSDTGIIIAIRQVNTSGNLVAGTYTEWSATVSSGTSFAIVATPVAGSDQVYAAGSTTQVFLPASASQQNSLIDGVLTSLNQDGTVKAGVVGTSALADGSVTSAKMAGVSSAWVVSPTLTFASATDSPTFTATAVGDYTTGLYPGVRVKADQTQAIQNYWSFDTNSADSKGGATMADIGTPTYTAGKFSNALTLNGSNQALSITDAAALKPTDNFTIGCWIKPTNATNANTIFQSYSDNTNAQGIIFGTVVTTGVMTYRVGSGSADDTTTLSGTTNVCDGAQHYVVLSVRNNYAQIYVDGKLEVSGYSTTPTYNATNYVRIGVRNVAGTSVASTWFTGQIDDLFIAAYALDEQTIAAKYAAATAQGTGDLTLTKYFLCTASSYSAPNTTVTLYGGTDHTLANATISNAYYSTQKAPYGFPLNPDKWKVEFSSSGTNAKTNPTAATWYYTEIGASLSVPIGKWNLEFQGDGYATNAGTSDVSIGLSALTNGLSDTRLNHQAAINGTLIISAISFSTMKDIKSKTTYQVIAQTSQGGTTNLGLSGYTIIRATSTLL